MACVQAACVRKMYASTWGPDPTKAPRAERREFYERVQRFLESIRPHQVGCVDQYCLLHKFWVIYFASTGGGSERPVSGVL